ncbi:hypothetical protein RJ035_002755 [Blastomyces gilchristii]
MGRNIFRKVIQLTRSDDLHENRSRYSVEAAAHNANNSRLYNLPPELLATINDYLPLASGLTLRFTCSKFYQSSVFNHTQRCADQTDRFEALCHLEYDGVVKGYCCRGCLRRHLYYTAFSNEELAKKAHARYCLATMKCFRIGLFRELSFAELQKAYREQVKVRGRITEVHDCNDQGNLVAPEDRKWLAHTFASKDSLLETHCEAVRDWQSKNPLNSRKPLQQLQLLQHENLRTPDFGNLFTSVTLPRSRWRQWFHGFIRGGGLGTRSTAIRSH